MTKLILFWAGLFKGDTNGLFIVEYDWSISGMKYMHTIYWTYRNLTIRDLNRRNKFQEVSYLNALRSNLDAEARH